jgi:cold shock protein
MVGTERTGGGLELTIGRILQFDQTRGYGFVAADDGGEDVFLHASLFDGDPDLLVPGAKVRFQVMTGDRGRKAFAVDLVADEPEADEKPVPAPPRPVLGPSGPQVPAPPSQAAVGPSAALTSVPAAAEFSALDEEQMCDVLSPPQFRQELTELLLNTVPELTGQQILQARQGIFEFAKKHGWIDG